MLTRSFLILAGGALATMLALACPAPAAASQPGSGLTEIPDPELELMRGRYTVGGNSVAWFGVTMISTWTDAAGRTLEGGMTLGMDFTKGGQVPVVSFTPVVSITDADAPLPVTTAGSRSIDGSGLANASGLLQSVQLAGDGNTASNLAHLRVREGTGAPDGMAAPMYGHDAVSRLGNASVLAGFDGDTARVKLQIDGQGAVEQWIRSGSVGQSIQLAADHQVAANRLQIDLVQQPLAAQAMLAQNVAQAMVTARGIGPGL